MLTQFRRALIRSKLFQYRGSRFIYLVMEMGSRTIFRFFPDYVTIPTPYGKFSMRKSARLFSTMIDFVEPQVQEFFHNKVKNANVFVDVGAAYGWYTLKAARLMRNPRVISIEPDIYSIHILQANIHNNNLLNCVTLVNAALADYDGYIRLCGRVMRCRRLDGLLQDLHLSYRDVDFVKIDVEGMALRVLKGMKSLISEGRPALLIELHEGEEEVPVFLKNMGYKVELCPGLMITAEALSK